MTRRVVQSDDEGPQSNQDSDGENGAGTPEDISQIQDPTRLRAIIRELQLNRNTQELHTRHRFGDVTNTPPREKRKRKRQRQDDAAHKRTRHDRRLTPEPGPADDREDSDAGLDPAAEPSGDDTDAADARDDDAAVIKRVGRHYVLSYNLWVRGNAHIFDFRLDAKYDEKKRFENDATKRQGQLHDIEKLLPQEYRGRKRDPTKTWLARLFMTGVSSQRSNTSTRLRKIAGAAIFDCLPTDLLDPDTRTAKFRDQIGWIIKEGTSGHYASLEVPIIHDSWAGDYDLKTCFLNRALMRLFVALIRGPSAATTMLNLEKKHGVTDTVSTNVPGSDSMEKIFGINHTEPGAIAGSAVLAIWALSADTDLKARGDVTHIDYEARFDEYLEILTEGLRQESTSVLNVFREWDRVIFPTSDSGHGSNGATGQGSGNKKAMDALRAEMAADGAEE